MAETLTRSIETSDERERRELFARMDGLEAFIKENAGSPLLLELRAGLQNLLPEEEAVPEDEPVVPEAIPEAPSDEAEEADVEDEAPVLDELADPIEEKESEAKPTMTFERARQMEDPLSDEFILGALSGKLQKPGGERALMGVKSYFDNAPPDASDKEYATTNSQVIQLRDELTDFVAKELKIHAPAAYRSHIEDRKRVFFAKLEQGKQAFRDYVKGREAGKDLRENPAPNKDLAFYGLTLMVEGGKSVDLLEASPSGVRSNLLIQRGVMGNFVQWSSDEYAEKKLSGDKPELTRRVYLNPRPQDSVKVFSEVVHAIEAAGLTAKGKIYDRTSDSLAMKSYDSAGKSHDVRGDGIVLYATSEEADKLLKIAEDVYRAHGSAFHGRALSSVPFEISPGFGIGDEPMASGSLTSHRSDAIEKVLQQVRDTGETDPSAQVRLFRKLWATEAALENINANNPAFNDH